MRTLIYARYSTDLQNSRSIEGQLADCRARAEREGWTILGEYCDAAISGGKGIDAAARPGLAAMLERVQSGGIDQVLTDTTSRIARNERDGLDIRDIMRFANCRLFTLADGVVEGLTASIKAAVDAQQRRDIAHNIRRGQRTSVEQGRAPAGIAYGYRQANRLSDRGDVIRGLREIDADQADIVRRIFREIASGRSALQVAQSLNAEGIRGPRGGTWSANTITGDLKRANGLIRNRLYIGELIVGRTAKVENPTTRKAVIRPIDQVEWRMQPVPHLAIVDREVWDRAHAELAARSGGSFQRQVRPKHILSGLGQCGLCGEGWIKVNGEKWSCGGRRRGNGCTNTRIIETRRYMAEVQSALTHDLLHPDLAEAYEREYRAAREQRVADERGQRQRLERRLAECNRKIERLALAIANGAGDVPEIVALATAERAVRDGLTIELAQLDALNIVALVPGIFDQYRREITNLHEALADPAATLEAVPRFRALIHRILLTPKAQGRGVDVKVEGRLDEALRLATGESMENLAKLQARRSA